MICETAERHTYTRESLTDAHGASSTNLHARHETKSSTSTPQQKSTHTSRKAYGQAGGSTRTPAARTPGPGGHPTTRHVVSPAILHLENVRATRAPGQLPSDAKGHSTYVRDYAPSHTCDRCDRGRPSSMRGIGTICGAIAGNGRNVEYTACNGTDIKVKTCTREGARAT